MKRYSLVLFYILAFAISWAVWFSAIAQANGAIGWRIPGPFAFIGLSIAAVLAAALEDGWRAITDLLGRWVRWRVPPVWYAVALLLTPALGLLAVGAGLALRVPNPVGADGPLKAALAYFATSLLLFLATEETAWRGFALPRFQARYTALTSSLIVGLLWGLWHTPLFFTPGSFQASLPFVGFLVSALATSVLATWIFNHTHGSVLLAALFHASTDAGIAYLGVMAHERTLFWVFVALQLFAAALVVWRDGPTHLARSTDRAGTVYPP